ncbi:RtcB family protein [Methylopila musalis]|uniref:3'-phosphate/5'-hydroxy nucleic acid ligase n=1 Tax=Methylopila musalis TaxID=1134781 RepID=A0ABW3Z450_9HYPH
MITGKTLIDWGFAPGPWFAEGIAAAQAAAERGEDPRAAAAARAPKQRPQRAMSAPGALPYHLNIRAENDGDAANIANVEAHMAELMRVPTVRAGAVMPDACPAGRAPGTIPVGGVVATENAIHPGFHSADICCSMALTSFANADPTALLDAGMTLSHFGGGGRPRGAQIRPPAEILQAMEANPFLKTVTSAAIEHFATQGDGNHFFSVGRRASTGEVTLVTHHGSRKPGALLYKAGMAAAEATRRAVSPETPSHNAWIEADTPEGEAYWEALQIIRLWTKANHYAIHDLVAEALGLKPVDRFWNEHNFVFRRTDGLFYHAKGATPAYDGFSADDSGLTLTPLNMGEPILITRGRNAPNGLGFAPHGAGRNFSRSAFLRAQTETPADQLAAIRQRIDARFFSGIPDASELPAAYKNADTVRAQIAAFGLCDVVDTVEPIGCIMAGDWQANAPWRRTKAARDTQADSVG